MTTRLLVFAAVLVAAWVIVRVVESRRGGQPDGLRPGVTMFVTDNCRICPQAAEALASAGIVIMVEPATGPLAEDLSVRSVPTVVVVDGAGQVRLRRTGRSVVTDARLIAAAGRGLAATA